MIDMELGSFVSSNSCSYVLILGFSFIDILQMCTIGGTFLMPVEMKKRAIDPIRFLGVFVFPFVHGNVYFLHGILCA